MKTFRFVVSGRVQGVNFRYYTVREAERLGIKGTVRNLDDGDVEVVAQADAERIAQFEQYLHRGPSFARVTAVQKSELPGERVFPDFDIAY